MSARLHIPVIGSGSIGTRHHHNLVALGISSELVSYQQTGIAGLESSIKRGADGLVIATATGIRNELVSVCAAHNVPMYIEKPLAFTTEQARDLYQLCPESLQQRSMAGYMMRYHPLFRSLCERGVERIYRFDFTIGHDVTRWRNNWLFSESYAASAYGGGVLLDLCHELDMAHTLFPGLGIRQVTCLGHDSYPGVDFNTEVSLTDNSGVTGVVNMDYLSPVSTREARLFGRDVVVGVDFNNLSYRTADGQNVQEDKIGFERNDMFIDTMQDFIRLILGAPAGDWCPRLDRVRSSVEFIAEAWQRRHFIGNLSHSIS